MEAEDEEGRGGGRAISRDGFENRVAREAAWAFVGVRARRLVGRLERGSWEVGIDSGIGSDIVEIDGMVGKLVFWCLESWDERGGESDVS